MTKRQDRRPKAEWDADVKQLANKILPVVVGYVATEAIAALALVIRHIADEQRD
jgi:hypothetical protein